MDTEQTTPKDVTKETTENAKETSKENKQKLFDPYAPHRIKWWGWPLLILLIVAGAIIYFVPECEPVRKEIAGIFNSILLKIKQLRNQ